MRHGLPVQDVTDFRRSRSVDEPHPLSARNGLCPFLHVELGEDVPDVRLDGRGRDGKRSRDLLVDTPLRNQMEDVALTAGERPRNCASLTRSELRRIARTPQEWRCYRFRRARLKRGHTERFRRTKLRKQGGDYECDLPVAHERNPRRGGTRAIASAISRLRNGLRSTASTPACCARRVRSRPPWPLMSRIGISGSRWWISAARAIPESCGITSSISTTSKRSGSARRTLSAAAPDGKPAGW